MKVCSPWYGFNYSSCFELIVCLFQINHAGKSNTELQARVGFVAE